MPRLSGASDFGLRPRGLSWNGDCQPDAVRVAAKRQLAEWGSLSPADDWSLGCWVGPTAAGPSPLQPSEGPG